MSTLSVVPAKERSAAPPPGTSFGAATGSPLVAAAWQQSAVVRPTRRPTAAKPSASTASVLPATSLVASERETSFGSGTTVSGALTVKARLADGVESAAAGPAVATTSVTSLVSTPNARATVASKLVRLEAVSVNCAAVKPCRLATTSTSERVPPAAGHVIVTSTVRVRSVASFEMAVSVSTPAPAACLAPALVMTMSHLVASAPVRTPRGVGVTGEPLCS
mmetsp:Transcript_28034/g.96949  ORF Transcript_28034/g.96949 Transcript_28034/m.96949 type:complete len:221 (-) Transcript_28034:1821-2483(-)